MWKNVIQFWWQKNFFCYFLSFLSVKSCCKHSKVHFHLMWCSSYIAPTFVKVRLFMLLGNSPSHFQQREQPNFIIGIHIYVYVFGYDLLCGWKNTLHSSNITNIFKCGWFEAQCLLFCCCCIFGPLWFGMLAGWLVGSFHFPGTLFFLMYVCSCGVITKRGCFFVKVIYISKSLFF